MLSKGSVAILPLVLLLIAWWQKGRITEWDLARTAPFFFIAILLTGVNIWFQSHGGGTAIRSASFAERLSGAGAAVWFYLGKALLPINLTFIYPLWKIRTIDLLWWLPLEAAVAFTALLMWKSYSSPANEWRTLLLAWGFFCVALAPALGLVDVGFMKYSLVADHYQYIAIIGVVTIVAAGWTVWHQHARWIIRGLATGTAAVLVGTLTLLNWQQSQLYGSAVRLYEATLDKNQECWLAHNNLGIMLFRVGQSHAAIMQYQQALQLNPDDAEAHTNLGNALFALGQPEDAIKQYQQALQLKPDYAVAHNNFGRVLLALGQPQDAIEQYQQAAATET